MTENENNPFEFNNLHRQVSVNIMLGIVEAVDNKTGRVTVSINDKKLHNLRVIAQRAGGNGKLWWLPAKGEQVILLSPFGNTTEALILGSLYYGKPDAENEFNTGLPEDLETEASVRKIYYPDGTTSSYDAINHEYTIAIKQNKDTEEKTKIRIFANEEKKESGIEITIGNTKIQAYDWNDEENAKANSPALLLEKGNAQCIIQHDETISIKTNGNINLTADKHINLTAGTIELVANSVNVKKK